MPLPYYDFETEQEDILRKQKLADTMMSGALSPMQMPSAPGVKVAWTEGLNKLLQGYLAGKMNEEGKTARTGLREKMDSQLREGLEGLGTASNPEANKQALLQAMSSGHPVLREFAMKRYADLNKGALEAKDLVGISTPESVLANRQDPSKWVPKRDLKGMNAGEVLVDAAGNLASPGAPKLPAGAIPQAAGAPGLPSGPGWSTVKIDGDLYQQTPTGLKKLDNSTKVSTTLHNSPIIQGQKAGVEAWSKQAAETVGELASSARQSVSLLGKLSQLEAISNDKTYSGPLAGPAQFVAGLANQAGIKVDTNKLHNAEAFNSVATQAWAALMQQNGGARGLVKEESEKLAQSLPALVQTPQGRAQIIATLRQAATQNIGDAKLASQQYSKALQTGNLQDFTFGLSSTQLPQTPPMGAAPGGTASNNGQPSWLPPGFKILQVR